MFGFKLVELAEVIDVRPRALYDKLSGKYDFKLNEFLALVDLVYNTKDNDDNYADTMMYVNLEIQKERIRRNKKTT